jgi:hypothetical protein
MESVIPCLPAGRYPLNYGTGDVAKLTSIGRFYNKFLKILYFRKPKDMRPDAGYWIPAD